MTQRKERLHTLHDAAFNDLPCCFFCAVELPVLDNELYHAVKPGLSSYKDNPEEVCIPANTLTYCIFGVNWLPLDHQIHWDFLWVGFR